jgi:hypothetical protein
MGSEIKEVNCCNGYIKVKAVFFGQPDSENNREVNKFDYAIVTTG